MLLKDAWKNTTVICADCKKPMNLNPVGTQFNYQCECGQKFSVNYFEKILDNIASLDAKRQMNNDLGSLEGEKFVISKKLKCVITEENSDMTKWTVAVKVIS